MERTPSFIAIDLKSFFASVECVKRKFDPLTTNLVVADSSRTEKTICLAVSPTLKKYGIPGRARLFEVVQKVKEVNQERLRHTKNRVFTGSSFNAIELEKNPNLKLDYIVAPPEMARYMEVSTQIYNIYLKYIASTDIHVYSIDEVFMDVTAYLKTYQMSAHDLAMKIIQDVLKTTGITATAGIGTNLYLAKIAMDIEAKRIPADENGVRIAELNELTYREKLWDHRPLTDFWRLGRGYQKKLEANGLMTMGDIAACSIGRFRRDSSKYNEELLYKLFGINAELLIDHAWGYEPCTISQIKAYKPSNNSISLGQVLTSPYEFSKAKLVILEMTDSLVLDLVRQNLVTDQIVLTIGYDVENISDPKRNYLYHGEIVLDHYGRKIPKPAHGSINLKNYTSSTKMIMEAVSELLDRIADKSLLVRRMYVVANHIILESKMNAIKGANKQFDLFNDTLEKQKEEMAQKELNEKEKKMQKAVLSIKNKFGKNAVLKGMNFEEGATAKTRNKQIGGHKA